MKAKTVWFLLGFAVSWFLWSGIAAYRSMPKDLTQKWPERSREMARSANMSWMKSAKGGGLGNFSFWVPFRGSAAAAEIYPTEDPKYPLIWIHDEKGRGRLDGIFITDAKQRGFAFEDKDGDGAIDSFGYTTGYDRNGVSWHDANMDGVFDLRLGPYNGGKFRKEVNIGGSWHTLIITNNVQFVATKTGLKKVRPINGVWNFETTNSVSKN